MARGMTARKPAREHVFPFRIPAPRLRMKVYAGGTYCGVGGCPGRFGRIETRDGRRLHVLDNDWRMAPGTFQEWEHVDQRREGRLAGRVFTVEPVAIFKCPKCQAPQRLPDGAADPLEGPMRFGEKAAARKRPSRG